MKACRRSRTRMHAAVSGSPVEGPPRYGVRLSVEAESPEAAIATCIDQVRAAATDAGLPAWPIVHVECMTEAELDRVIERPPVPELVGVSEIARLLAEDGAPVTRQRASALARRDDFPEPVVRLAAGPVWTKDSVRNFVESWERKPGRPTNQTTALDYTLIEDVLPQSILIAGLAILVGAGVVALTKKGSSFVARLRQAGSDISVGTPEAAQVLDLAKKLSERDQSLDPPSDVAAQIRRQARAAAG